MAEGARLESVYTETYRGFESLSLRQNKNQSPVLRRKAKRTFTGLLLLLFVVKGFRTLVWGSTSAAGAAPNNAKRWPERRGTGMCRVIPNDLNEPAPRGLPRTELRTFVYREILKYSLFANFSLQSRKCEFRKVRHLLNYILMYDQRVWFNVFMLFVENKHSVLSAYSGHQIMKLARSKCHARCLLPWWDLA